MKALSQLLRLTGMPLLLGLAVSMAFFNFGVFVYHHIPHYKYEEKVSECSLRTEFWTDEATSPKDICTPSKNKYIYCDNYRNIEKDSITHAIWQDADCYIKTKITYYK